MNEHQRYEHGFGPVYSVPLIDKLPLNRENPGGMLQQMPSAADLEGIRTYRQGARVCAGYEVLLNHWRLQQAEIERLRSHVTHLRMAIGNRIHMKRCQDRPRLTRKS